MVPTNICNNKNILLYFLPKSRMATVPKIEHDYSPKWGKTKNINMNFFHVVLSIFVDSIIYVWYYTPGTLTLSSIWLYTDICPHWKPVNSLTCTVLITCCLKMNEVQFSYNTRVSHLPLHCILLLFPLLISMDTAIVSMHCLLFD